MARFGYYKHATKETKIEVRSLQQHYEHTLFGLLTIFPNVAPRNIPNRTSSAIDTILTTRLHISSHNRDEFLSLFSYAERALVLSRCGLSYPQIAKIIGGHYRTVPLKIAEYVSDWNTRNSFLTGTTHTSATIPIASLVRFHDDSLQRQYPV